MKVIKWLDDHLEEAILIVLLVCMACIMIVQVVSRYLFNYSISWSEELTQYMFVWATFLSVSFCVKKRISIKIEQFLNVLPDQGKTFLRLLRHTLVIIFCIVMLPFCVTYVQQAIDSQATSAALGLPMVYIQSAPLVGFILLLIRVIQAWIREARNFARGFRRHPAAEEASAQEAASAQTEASAQEAASAQTEASAQKKEPVHYKYEDASFEKQFAQEHPIVTHPLADLPHAEHVLEKMADKESSYAVPLTADRPIKEQLEDDRSIIEPLQAERSDQMQSAAEQSEAKQSDAEQPAAEQSEAEQPAAEQSDAEQCVAGNPEAEIDGEEDKA